MRSWAASTLRIFAVLHIIMGVLGIGGVAWMYVVFARQIQGPNAAYPYELQFYCVYTIVNLLCLVFLIRAGAALWRLEPRGQWLSNVVLGFEIIWFLAEWETLAALLPLWGDKAKLIEASIWSIFDTGEIGTAPQTLTGYPLIAVIAVNVAYRKLSRASGVRAPRGAEAEGGWKPWPRALLRVFGILDIVVAVYGLNVAAVWFVVVTSQKIGVDAAHPYVLPIYRTETGFAVLYALFLIPTGVALWRLKRLGWWMSCALLGLAVIFLLTEQGLRFLLPIWGGEAKALGNSFENSVGSLIFILPIILYQLLAVVSISVAFRRLRAAGAEILPTASA
jgi:hypothetical protein